MSMYSRPRLGATTAKLLTLSDFRTFFSKELLQLKYHPLLQLTKSHRRQLNLLNLQNLVFIVENESSQPA